MLIEIVRRTPPWVFVLFFVLLAAGYFQSSDRVVSRNKISILPIAMIALSIHGVISDFGMVPVSLFSWAIGVVVAVWAGVRLPAPRGVCFSIETQLFSVPGSWIPLALMMTIFFAKYAVAVILARQLPIATAPGFIGSISLCYGFLSGLFLARALVIWRSEARAARGVPDSARHADTPHGTRG